MTSFRKISQLQSVKLCSPRAGQKGRAFSEKAEGLRFEETIGDIILDLGLKNYSHCWFEFKDSNGKGWCQVDHGFFKEDFQVIIECKRSWHSYAKGQILQLYKPIVEFYWKRPALGIVACADRGEKTLVGIENAIQRAKKDGFAIL